MSFYSSTSLTIASIVVAALIYLYRLLSWYRFDQLKKYPRLTPDLIWGHLKAVGLATKGLPANAHSDYAWKVLRDQFAPKAPFLVFDLRPVLSYPITVVFSHTTAEECSKATKRHRYSLAKSPTNRGLAPVTGPESIIIKNGEEWKAIRKQFNPGFAPTHLITLLPTILDKTKRFIQRLDAQCASGEVFELDELCTTLTFDIIGAVGLDIDLNSQCAPTEQHPLVRNYADLLPLFSAGGGGVASITSLTTRWKRRKFANRVDFEVKKAVREKFADIVSTRNGGASSSRGRSIVELALNDVDELTPQILQETADQIKSFMFAGHDTTSTLLQWVFYLLSIHPKVMATLTAELDSVFGANTSPQDVTAQILERGEEALKKLQYTSAIIKETLRLHPPAGSARFVAEDDPFAVIDPNTGEELPLFGVVYLCHFMIQRDEAVYGSTATKWVPERWLGNTDTSMATEESESKGDDAAIPVSAWRPFERGPRNCIGQELANIEARVIIACAARQYKFQKIGVGELLLDDKGLPTLDEAGVYKVQSEMYSRHQITSKPVDGTRVKVAHAS